MNQKAVAISTTVIICGIATALPCIAADYPDRPIRIIVPSAPGGA